MIEWVFIFLMVRFLRVWFIYRFIDLFYGMMDIFKCLFCIRMEMFDLFLWFWKDWIGFCLVFLLFLVRCIVIWYDFIFWFNNWILIWSGGLCVFFIKMVVWCYWILIVFIVKFRFKCCRYFLWGIDICFCLWLFGLCMLLKGILMLIVLRLMISKYIMWWISGGMCKVGVLFFIVVVFCGI